MVYRLATYRDLDWKSPLRIVLGVAIVLVAVGLSIAVSVALPAGAWGELLRPLASLGGLFGGIYVAWWLVKRLLPTPSVEEVELSAERVVFGDTEFANAGLTELSRGAVTMRVRDGAGTVHNLRFLVIARDREMKIGERLSLEIEGGRMVLAEYVPEGRHRIKRRVLGP